MWLHKFCVVRWWELDADAFDYVQWKAWNQRNRTHFPSKCQRLNELGVWQKWKNKLWKSWINCQFINISFFLKVWLKHWNLHWNLKKNLRFFEKTKSFFPENYWNRDFWSLNSLKSLNSRFQARKKWIISIKHWKWKTFTKNFSGTMPKTLKTEAELKKFWMKYFSRTIC